MLTPGNLVENTGACKVSQWFILLYFLYELFSPAPVIYLRQNIFKKKYQHSRITASDALVVQLLSVIPVCKNTAVEVVLVLPRRTLPREKHQCL